MGRINGHVPLIGQQQIAQMQIVHQNGNNAVPYGAGFAMGQSLALVGVGGFDKQTEATLRMAAALVSSGNDADPESIADMASDIACAVLRRCDKGREGDANAT